jgi:Carboxylesterase family
VILFIHGGGFTVGSGGAPISNGARLAEAADAVVVTINYRLGSLGWLYHPELGGGNWGLRDQISGARVGARQHRGLRRRPGCGNGDGPVRRGAVDPRPAVDRRSRRSLRARDPSVAADGRRAARGRPRHPLGGCDA